MKEDITLQECVDHFDRTLRKNHSKMRNVIDDICDRAVDVVRRYNKRPKYIYLGDEQWKKLSKCNNDNRVIPGIPAQVKTPVGYVAVIHVHWYSHLEVLH